MHTENARDGCEDFSHKLPSHELVRQCSYSPPCLEKVRHPQQLLHSALPRLLFLFLFLFCNGLPTPLAALAPFALAARARVPTTCAPTGSPTRPTRPSASTPAPAPSPT